MKIGIVGTSFSVQRVASMLRPEDAFVEYVEYPCRLSQVPEILEQVQSGLDGIVFTGHRYIEFASKHSTATIPWTHIRRADAAVYRALLRAEMAGFDICRITYDHGRTVREVQQILCGELGVEEERVSLFRYNDTPAHEEYLRNPELAGHYANGACAYHRENLHSGRASFCLTDSASVESVMKKQGYPVFLVDFAEDDLVAALNDIRTRIQMYDRRKEGDYREAVLALTVRMKEEYGRGDCAFRQVRSISRIEGNLFRFAQEIDGVLERRSVGHYMIYAAREALEEATGSLRELSFADALLPVPDVEQVSLGIGYGVTHREAQTGALEANHSARQQNYSCWYVKNGGEVARGPFILSPPQEAREYDSQKLERISRETNVGITILNALSQAQRQFGFQSVTSSELAEMTGMSLNNIHRVIVKLEAKGYAEVVGRQSYAETGRPRRLIRLNLGFVPEGGEI